jgi:hypothetical protein
MTIGGVMVQRAVGYVLTAIMIAVLVAAWIVTAPLLELAVWLGDAYRHRVAGGQNARSAAFFHANHKAGSPDERYRLPSA